MSIYVRRAVGWLSPLVFCLVFPSGVVAADDESPTVAAAERPKIALVLSGGGAHAVAHLGVLRELERQRVPIDLVVGSGLGGLLGGLYAAGMSPNEIGALIKSTDWIEIFDPGSGRQDLSFRRKQDDGDFLIKYRVGIQDGKAQGATGLVSTGKLAWLLGGATLDAKYIDDFDQLPVAFRAVALDLLTGEEVDMASGSLELAILATLAAPGTFPPVRFEDRLLISGGLVNNLPVDIAKEWGADVVIAVDLPVHQSTADEVNSVFAVLDQVGNMQLQKSRSRGLELLDDTDILIAPDAQAVGNQDFAGLIAAARAGQEAALAAAPRLAGLSLGEAAYDRFVADNALKLADDPIIVAIELDNQSNVADGLIEVQVTQKLNAELDIKQLEQDLRKIYAMSLFETVDFRIDRGPEGATLKIITVEDITREKFWRFGINVEDDLEGNSAYTASASFTWTQLNRLGGEWRSVMRIGERQQLSTQFYQPLDERGRWFVEPSLGFVERNVNTFVDGEIDRQFRVTNLAATLAVGRVLGNVAELRVGLLRGSGETKVNIGPDMPTQDFDAGAFLASIRYDTIDNPFWPRFGTEAKLAWRGEREALGSDVDLDILVTGLSTAHSWGTRTLIGSFNVQAQVNTAPGVQNLLQTGGFLNLSGFPRDSLTGRYTGVARLIYYERIGIQLLRGMLDTPLFVGASLELGNAWQDSSDISVSNSLLAGSVFAGLDTIIGPVYLAGGLAEGGNSAFYLFIGRPF